MLGSLSGERLSFLAEEASDAGSGYDALDEGSDDCISGYFGPIKDFTDCMVCDATTRELGCADNGRL